ncbi:hypothetical protein [Sphingobacterium faecium]|uniref:hypothetical protein n=1 Tax=Sphingobacterium faecium TaxID=34087 RepID=UPI00247AE7FF|nr:hypothetical protein [Sphingobacterium faecium]WGQ15004.1 hypothetical protein QG727_01045 [Sphingobacterium faecium]
MKKYLYLIFLIIFLFIAYKFIAQNMPPKRFEYEIPLIQSSTSSKILIPVTMKDSTYLFLWDTGSETSMILKNQAKLRNIPIEMLAKKGTDTVVSIPKNQTA